MPRINLVHDLDGNIKPDLEDKGKKIFDEGNLILVVSELNGELSVQIMGAPSERVLDILHHAWKTYKKILRRMT